MGWRRKFLERVALPLAGRVSPFKAWDYYKYYAASQYDPNIHTLQLRLVKHMVAHAYHNVEFYKRKFDSVGFKPSDLHTLEDLNKIPITTKFELRNTPHRQLIARNFPLSKLRMSNTSGTTGERIVLFQDAKTINYMFGAQEWTRHNFGMEIGDSILRFTPNECQACIRNPHDPTTQKLGALFFKGFEKGIAHTVLHPRKTLAPPPKHGNYLKVLPWVVREIERSHQKIFMVYPLYAFMLSNFILEAKGRLIPEMKLIDCSGSMLTHSIRRRILAAMGLHAFQSWGGSELGRIAGECLQSKGLMHQLQAAAYVQFLNPEEQACRPGEYGNLIVTHLRSYAMPLIRFEHGDVGYFKAEPCACGRASPLMDVVGRIQGILLNSNNGFVAAKQFWEGLLEIQGINLFQLIQQDMMNYTLDIVPTSEYSTDTEARLRLVLKELLGARANLVIKQKPYIDCEHSGKFMLVKSNTLNEFRCKSVRQIKTEIN